MANKFLEDLGLRLPGEQYLMKTYPSNSGDMPIRAERELWLWGAGSNFDGAATLVSQPGSNRMTALGATSLMRAITDESIPGPGARAAKNLLLRKRSEVLRTGLALGFPLLADHYAKGGCGNEAINDVMDLYLPRTDARIVLAVFTNGHDLYRTRSPLGATNVLAGFMEEFLVAMGLWDQEAVGVVEFSFDANHSRGHEQFPDVRLNTNVAAWTWSISSQRSVRYAVQVAALSNQFPSLRHPDDKFLGTLRVHTIGGSQEVLSKSRTVYEHTIHGRANGTWIPLAGILDAPPMNQSAIVEWIYPEDLETTAPFSTVAHSSRTTLTVRLLPICE
jgi:hypothetical protein